MPDVSVKLKDIDESNWMDVVLLTSSQGPSPLVLEEFVASNALSICQAVYEETWNIKAVYCGRKAVGFVMYGYCEERDQFELCRLMIDRNHQGKGFGTIALKLSIDEMFDTYDCDRIFILVHKDNERARHIYLKYGFVSSGEMVGQEELMYFDKTNIYG